MAKDKERKISGTALRKARFRLAFTQGELGKEIGLSEVRVRKIEASEVGSVRPKVLRALALLLNKNVDEVLEELAPQSELDPNLEPYSERPVPEIPTFDLEIAAGPWSEVSSVAELNSPRKIDDGRFRIFVRGDSMSPDWPNGCLVEFRCLRPASPITDGDTLTIGEDYYVQVGEEATFKRLVEFDDDIIVLRAVNKKAYPKPLVARRSDILRMAIAQWMLSKPKKRGVAL